MDPTDKDENAISRGAVQTRGTEVDEAVINHLMTTDGTDQDDGGPPSGERRVIDTIGDINADPYWHGMAVSDETKSFQIGTQLTDKQQQEMKDLLMEFRNDVFDSKPGKTDLIMHKIDLTDQTPVWQPPYKLPESLREETEKELNTMLEQDIIQYDPDTKYNSPMIVFRKPQGGIRIVHNYIQLNRKTVVEKYPMTNANQLLNRVAGAKYLSKIDMNKFFFQLVLHPESRACTGFNTEWGTYSYKRLPAGLSGSAITAQRLIDRILRGAYRHSGALLDDVLIFSASWGEHLTHVRDILTRLRAAGLTANINKCIFASDDMVVLGHRVKAGKIMPTEEKVKAIIDWHRPKNKHQLKAFLGTINFFHDFICHFAEITDPLTKLLAKSQPDKLNWGEQQQKSFERLKAEMMKKPILRPADPNKEYLLFCDGSSTAISSHINAI